MGISGTQIALNASDIVLLDDNFASIVNAIKWGRNVLNCCRKFLQFQLSVNLVAIIITITGALTDPQEQTPLNTVQLLWVNLIMDSLGALALASDTPEDNILEQPPHRRGESILSPHMCQYIVSQVIYQCAAIFTLLYAGDNILPTKDKAAAVVNPANFLNADQSFNSGAYNKAVASEVHHHTFSVIFTVFILLQVINQVVTRQLKHELNIFKGITKNRVYGFIIAIIVGVQILVVTFGQSFIGSTDVYWEDWVVSALISLGMIPWTILCRLFYNWANPRFGLLRFFTLPQSKKSNTVSPLNDVKVVSEKDISGTPYSPGAISQSADEDAHMLSSTGSAPKVRSSTYTAYTPPAKSTRFSYNFILDDDLKVCRIKKYAPLPSKRRD